MSPLARFVLPALAAAGTAYAACSTSGTQTIQNAGDASALASCQTFKGNIAIATKVADPISINGLQKLDGDLVVEDNGGLPTLSGDSLEEITGSFRLHDARAVSQLSFPKLTSVQSIDWVNVARLETLDFSAHITKADNIDIENTQLRSLEGINLEKVKKIFIANNIYITNITMKIENIEDALTITANNDDITVSFPSMAWASNMTFRNCSSVDLPALQTLNGSMGFIGNSFKEIALKNLTKVGGALSFVANNQLTNISLPLLEKVHDNLQIADNDKLRKINDIPKLESIDGALDFHGNLTDVELPALDDVKGAFNIQSTSDIQKQCDDFFKPLADKKKIQGKFTCEGQLAEANGKDGPVASKTAGNGAQKTGAASALNVQSNAAMGLMGVMAAIFI